MCRYVKYTNTTSQLMYVAQEHSIYGSSRVCVDNRKDTLYLGAVYTNTWGGVSTSRRNLGSKSFELANHLGNVLVTVSDKPIYKVSSGVVYFNPEVSSISDYYPFGAPIQGRSFSSAEYRFGFNTQEKTDEISGPGNHFTAQFWEYDGRLGRRWNTDPVTKPWESLYACLSDNPILLNDPDGNDPGNPKHYIVVGGDNLTKIGNKYGVSVDNLVKWNNIPKRNEIKIGQSLIVSDPTKVKQPEGFVWWQSENSPSTNSPNSNQPLKPLSTTASNKTQNAQIGGGSSSSTWDNISNGAGIASTYPTIASTWSYNSSGGDLRWTGKSGNYYVKSQVKMNGGYAKSIKYAQNASKNLSRVGNGLTIISVATSVISAGIAVNNDSDNTSTWVGLGIGVGGAIMTVVGSPVIVTGAAVGGSIWGIGQLFYGNEINGSIDSNFGYR